jgi:uncharacterized protein YuzE
MKIKYDKKADAKYVSIKQGKITHTKKEQDWLLFDCAKNGDVLGVEILDASKHLIGISVMGQEFISCNVIKSESFKNGNESLKFEIDKKELQLTTA